MTSTNKPKRIALCLILFFTTLGITLANATTEDNYRNDVNLLPRIYESTHTENGYKANLIINPHTTGIYAKETDFNLDLTISPHEIGGTFTENNYQLDLIPEKVFPDIPSLAVTNVVPSKTLVGQGYTVTIETTIKNKGFYFETFNTTTYANTTIIQTQSTTLPGKTSTTITFTWNTADVPLSAYTISAKAPLPDDTNPIDNTYTNGTVLVTIPGDVNGDKTVNILDAGEVSAHWYPGPPIGPLGYGANADINGDGAVDIVDMAIVSANWFESW